MTWFSLSANETEAQKNHVQMFVAVDIDFPSAPVRVWSGLGTIAFGAHTYQGVGDLGSISTPAENNRLVAERKTYQLSGVDPALVAESDIDGCFGRAVIEYFGFINPVTGALVADPEVSWRGRIDQINRVDGSSPIIEVNAEHRMIMLDHTDGLCYTHEHQQMFFPGDNGLKPVAGINLKTVVWGGKNVVAGTPVTDYGQDGG